MINRSKDRYLGALEEAMLISRVHFNQLIKRGPMKEWIHLEWQGMHFKLAKSARIHKKILSICHSIQGQRGERDQEAADEVAKTFFTIIQKQGIHCRTTHRKVFNIIKGIQ